MTTQAEPVKTEPVKTEPVKTEPVKTEPVKTEPVKTEPVKQQAQADEGDITAGDGTQGTDGSPVKAGEIEITVPDGLKVDSTLIEGFKKKAQELKLDSKGAQSLLDYYVENVKQTETAIKEGWEQQKSSWRETARKDKEIGGDAYKANVETARKALSTISPTFVAAIRDLDLGTHPEIVRLGVRLAKALSEDTLRDLGGGGNPPQLTDEESALRKAFPSMYADKAE